MHRRSYLKHSVALAGVMGTWGLLPHQAQAAWSAGAFEAKNAVDAFKALGLSAPKISRDISITAPEMADNGASVQVECATTLQGVNRLMVLVEKNNSPLCALFNITEQVEPQLTLRIKMAQSSLIWVVAITADQKVFFAQKDVRVTLGGCGD